MQPMANNPPVLGYASPGNRLRFRPLLYLAWIMAIWPQCFGVLMLVLYALTRDVDFAEAGFITLFLGTISVLIGFLLIAFFCSANRRAEPILIDRINRQLKWCRIIMLLNFPIAFVCAVLGCWLLR